jgi:hypothetical protein
MKICIFSILLSIFLSLSGSAQTKKSNNAFDENNLYHQAALAVFKKRLSEYGEFGNKDYRNITFYRRDDSIKLPKKIGDFEIEYLGLEALVFKFRNFSKNRKDDDRNSIPIMEVLPMTSKEGKLKIRFIDRWFSSNSKNVEFALEGGSIVIFSFDCEKRRFVLENVELWGI